MLRETGSTVRRAYHMPNDGENSYGRLRNRTPTCDRPLVFKTSRRPCSGAFQVAREGFEPSLIRV